jgi:hypothetical protein
MTDQSGGAEGSRGSPLSSSPQHRPAQIGRITQIQARMARAALRKTQSEVAAGTGCHLSTIFIFERNTGDVSRKNAGVIRKYYEDLGVSFIADAYSHVVKVAK